MATTATVGPRTHAARVGRVSASGTDAPTKRTGCDDAAGRAANALLNRIKRRLRIHADAAETLRPDLHRAIESAMHAALSGRATRPAAPTPSLELASAIARLDETEAIGVAVLLRDPAMLTGQDFAGRVGITRQRLNEWRRAGHVLAIEGAKRGFRFPAWQVDKNGRLLNGVREVLFHFADPLAALRFLTAPLDLLQGEAPLAVLRRGGAERIVALAAAAARGDHL